MKEREEEEEGEVVHEVPSPQSNEKRRLTDRLGGQLRQLSTKSDRSIYLVTVQLLKYVIIRE